MRSNIPRSAKLFQVSLLAILASYACSAQLRQPEPARTPASAVLLELFTSEGCSSCPPADALLRHLNGAISSSGHRLIALSEHVTYWNRLGWADPFSSDIYTERQSGYGQRFHLDSIYTPQLVVNGAEEVVGSNVESVQKAINAQPRDSALTLTIVRSARAPDGISLVYSVSSSPAGKVDLFAAIADDLDSSSVLRGENGGRTLSHVAVVRSLIHLGQIREAASNRQVTIPLHASALPTGAHQHLVLFAQAAGLGPVLGVTERAIGSD